MYRQNVVLLLLALNYLSILTTLNFTPGSLEMTALCCFYAQNETKSVLSLPCNHGFVHVIVLFLLPTGRISRLLERTRSERWTERLELSRKRSLSRPSCAGPSPHPFQSRQNVFCVYVNVPYKLCVISPSPFLNYCAIHFIISNGGRAV
jgi:hypothetical protein